MYLHIYLHARQNHNTSTPFQCLSAQVVLQKHKLIWEHLTLKHRETHGCVVSTVATDALVLKHQAISILSTD